jgi:hypothetical protein
VSGDNENWVIQRIETIAVDIVALKGMISAKTILGIPANSVTIMAGYTGINIGYHTNFAFDFNVLLKYANFKYDSDLEIDSKEEVSNSKNIVVSQEKDLTI